jgi:UDP:flavonoid glycosyltransferase YjiC (YdhE family)
MSQILITWELGGGLGHLSIMRGVATELLQRGHRVSIAARELTNFQRFFSDLDVQAFQSPYFPNTFAGSFDLMSTFPHILYNCCCGDSDTFLALTKAWQNLFDLVRPDAVLFDHSPTAIFASRGRSFFRATINNGFFSPPNQSPLPSWRSQAPDDLDQFASDENRVLELLNRVASRLDQCHLGRVSDLYAELDKNMLFTYPELDHFPNRQDGNYIGTWESTAGKPQQWPSNDRPRVFAYLKSFPSLPELLFHLARMQLSTIIFAPNAIAPEILCRFCQPQSNLVLADSAIDLNQVAAECDFAITNGTHGTVATMLRGGTPTLNIPLTLEQQILSERVSSSGMGIVAFPGDPSSVEPALIKLLKTSSLTANAQAFRQKYIAHDAINRFLYELSSQSSSRPTDDVFDLASSKTVNRAIAVIGPWRGGTSLVTGILAKLGVYVGTDFVDAKTAYCTYEDISLREQVMRCFDEREGRWQYYGSYEDRIQHLRNWLIAASKHSPRFGAIACGGKHPIFCKLIPELKEAWSMEGQIALTLVSVIRSPESIHRSWTKPIYPDGSHWWPRGDRVPAVEDLILSRDRCLVDLPHLAIDYEQLLAEPRATILRLTEELELPKTRLDDAVALVRQA